MHSEPQISPHEMAPPFRFSHGGRIHRSCTAQFIRCALGDKLPMQMAVDQHLHACVLERAGAPGPGFPAKHGRILHLYIRRAIHSAVRHPMNSRCPRETGEFLKYGKKSGPSRPRSQAFEDWRESILATKAMRGRLALQKHSARNQGNTHLISRELVSAHASSRRFCARTPLRMIDENSPTHRARLY